jgi:hypothetical protein
LFFITESGFAQVRSIYLQCCTGNWNAPGSWTEVGSDVANIQMAMVIVIILSGGGICLNGARSAYSVTVNAGGTLTANGGGLTVRTMSVSGTYVHAINGGAIPVATWALTAACTSTGVTNTWATNITAKLEGISPGIVQVNQPIYFPGGASFKAILM